MFCLCLCLLLAHSGRASINRGTIRGTVVDPQGKVMPKVAVRARNIATGVEEQTRTDSAGLYVLPELVPGTYVVNVEMAGFKPDQIANVLVKADDVATVDVRLNVGTAVQRVEVSAAQSLVETTASNFSVPVDPKNVEELPVLGRDIQSLVQLIPGVTRMCCKNIRGELLRLRDYG